MTIFREKKNIKPVMMKLKAGTENRFVVGYEIFPNPKDTRIFIPYIENLHKRLGVKFETVIADVGYGSEENVSVGAVKYVMTTRNIKKV